MKCLRSLEHWYSGFESHSRHGCLRLICVCGVMCSLLPYDGLIPRPRSPTDCLGLRKRSQTKHFTDALCSKWEQQEQRWIETTFCSDIFGNERRKKLSEIYIYGWDLHECVLWSENARDKTAIYLPSLSFEEWMQVLRIRHMNARTVLV
jgi:hypothetical protein